MQAFREEEYTKNLDFSLWKRLIVLAKPFYRHLIVIMVLMALIFIIGGMYGAGMGGVMSIVSIFMTIFMTALELLVAYIQAYVFTILSSLFIGMAQHEPEHE